MKKVVIIEPNSAGVKLIDASLRLGCKVYVLTHNSGDRLIASKHLQNCEVVVVDTNDEDAVKDKLLTINAVDHIDAIVPGFEYYVPLSSRMNALMGLRGLPVQTVMAMRYKHEMRRHLTERGVRSPAYTVVSSMDELVSAENDIVFPCVLKPSHLAGSLYIKKLNNMDELKAHYAQLLSDGYTDLGYSMAGYTVIEEYISGREYSVEGYVHDGNITYVSVTDKFLGEEPHFVEMGHITRARIDEESKKALMDYTASVVHALNLNIGPFHCEMRLTDKGPVLIEIGARLVGDNISEIIELSTGVSLAEKMVQGYLGESITDYHFDDYRCHSGVRFLYGKEGAQFNGFTGLNEVTNMPGFVRFSPLMEIGSVIPAFTDFRARIGEVVFVAETQEEVRESLDCAVRLLQLIL